MKVIASSESIKVPTNVKVSVHSRVVTVQGKRATNRKVTVTKYFGVRKELAAVRTVCSHIENMIKGVQYGFQYKMQTLHAHFPINVIIPGDGSKVQIKNFLGEKATRTIPMVPGVKAVGGGGTGDSLFIQGNNLEDVSKCAALIQQSCAARHKDIRKFLDGIYVTERGTVEEMK
ncbi:hypothetical protein Aperf_G00000065388 [Anoplocephala perfoliata]